MATLLVPSYEPDEEEAWPTLGHLLVAWLEAYAVYGPGDLSGDPYVVEETFAAWLHRAYQVFPRGHPRAGRRRFSSAVLSERKGLGKTEKLAMVAFAEAHPDAPVRCAGWRRSDTGDGWVPDARGISRDAYCPLVAYTKDQTEELAYGALKAIIRDGPLGDQYDVGEDRIIHIASRNKVAPLAGSPSARDGARTTWQGFDETHRLHRPALLKARQTMMANLPKRTLADAWSMDTTTAYEPGEGSVGELTHAYAEQIAAGLAADPRMFFFHRQADDDETLDLETREGVERAVRQASGPAASWSNIDSIVDQWFDPRTDPSYWKRVWANMVVRGGDAAYDFRAWTALADSTIVVPDAEYVLLTFDGSVSLDSTVITGITMNDGHLFEVGAWERPTNIKDWSVPRDEVQATLNAAFERWNVVKFLCDKPYWWKEYQEWQALWGADRVDAWNSRDHVRMSTAARAMATAIREASITHDGADATSRHIGNARRKKLPQVDEDGQNLWVLTKDIPNSPRKIDGAITATMAAAGRLELLAEGWTPAPKEGFTMVLGRKR